ncbi:hypothetical protein FQR65_LT17176 [Abscondita terminalis]|nr:hypothetical protein FQR65_LT17176 [Abscondita terminalis]
MNNNEQKDDLLKESDQPNIVEQEDLVFSSLEKKNIKQRAKEIKKEFKANAAGSISDEELFNRIQSKLISNREQQLLIREYFKKKFFSELLLIALAAFLVTIAFDYLITATGRTGLFPAGKKIKNFNDLTYHVMNIKINKLIEFINVDVLLDKTDTIDLDLKDIEGNYRLGYDFKGYYSSRVAVHNINNEQLESNQPNGDAREAAGILSDRLNPLGMLDIKVQVAGANYLRVDAPIDSFVNEIAFKNELQKTGGVMIFDQNYNDAQGDGEARKPLSDLIVTANDSAVTIQNKKVPTIEFGLTEGGAFSSMISALAPSGEDGQATAAPVITIVTDVDSFLNDVRSSYLYSQKEDQSDVLDDYYTYIIKPFQDIFVKQDTSEQIKAILADYFLVSFKEKNTNGTNTTKYFNLLSSSLIRSGLDIEKYIDTLEFVNSTNKYVYDSNAKGDDFKDDGKYSGLIDTVTIGDGISTSVTFTPSTMKINEVFNNLNKTVYSVINAQGNNFEKSILNEIAKYTIFAGEVATSTGNGQLTSNGTIVDDKQFIAVVTSASVAKSGATIFNAAGKGFTFNVSSLTTHEGVIFKDITPLLNDKDAFKAAIDKMVEFVKKCKANVIIAPEARGFLFASAVAYAANCRFVLARKPGKLPREVKNVNYKLEYGENNIQVHVGDLLPNDKVCIVDDVLATGGTTKAIIKLIEEEKAEVSGITFLIDLTFLHDKKIFENYNSYSIIEY